MLIEKFQQHLLSEANKPRTYKGSDFKPSMISLCERRQVMSAIGFPEQERTDSDILWVFKHGTSIHETLQLEFMKLGLIDPLYKKDGSPDEYKIRIERYNLNGKIDGVKSIGVTDDERYILEIKSASSTNFKNIVYKKKPNEKHVEQLMLYLGEKGIKNGIILYVNKDDAVDYKTKQFYDSKGINQIFHEFVVEFDQEIYDSIIARLDRMKAHLDKYREVHGDELDWQSEHLPPKITGSPCQTCPYKPNCKGERKKRTTKKTSSSKNKKLGDYGIALE